MPKMKLEFVFIQLDKSEQGFAVLGEFSIDSETPALPIVPIGAIGEYQIVDLPGKDFGGRIIDKRVVYSQKDIAGNSWDLLTRVIITLELTEAAPDAAHKDSEPHFQKAVVG
jgi:hypothetical protein